MNVKILLVLVSSLILFSGCVKKLETQTTCIEKTPLSIEQIKPVKILPIEWTVITPENANEVFRKLEDDNMSLVLFGLTDDSYENLAVNMANFRKFIVDQNSVIKAYKGYYEKTKIKSEKTHKN